MSRAELEALVVKLLGEMADLKRLLAEQRAEIARLKGLKGRPDIKPSGMDKDTEAKPGGKRAKRGGRGKVVPRVAAGTEILRLAPPTGSRFGDTRPTWCRTWCSARGSCATAVSVG